MNITLIGYGKMGQIIHKLIGAQFAQITSVNYIDESIPINAENTASTDVFIDFSHPSVFVTNLITLLSLKPNTKIVVGTTGWYEQLVEVESLIKANPESA